jgi:hypothetical protein
MNNPNRADISVFENLQQQANESMGCGSQLSVFNSTNTQDMLRRMKMMHFHVKRIGELKENIKGLEHDKQTRKRPEFYESLIKRTETVLRGTVEYLRTEAKNITILADQERSRLNFDYKIGEPLSKDGVDSKTYKERWNLADVLNAFYKGTMPNGEPYTKYLD